MTLNYQMIKSNLSGGYYMPMMQYLSKHPPVITADWQIWVIIATVIIGIVIIGIVVWKTRKW